MSQSSPTKASNRPVSSPSVKPSSKKIFWLVLLAIIFLSANMRAPIVALGSIAPIIKEALSISEAQIGWLGTIPVLMFALGASLTPKISKRFGLERTLIVSLLFLIIGIALRSIWVSWYGFLIGTLLLSISIGFTNTLVAPIIKQRAPNNIALMTAIFSLTMSMGAGIAAATVLPFSTWIGWQWTLGSWALLSVLALLLWLSLQFIPPPSHTTTPKPTTPDALTSVDTSRPISEHNTTSAPSMQSMEPDISVWRSTLAWQLATFLGVQSLLYYAVASFLPSIFISKGLTQTQAGSMASIFQFMTPFVIVGMTLLIRRNVSIRFIAMSLALLNALGILGITYFSIEMAWLWTALIGLGCAGIFTLSVMLFSMRTYTPNQASQLSGMAQTIGYMIAFFGPFGSGWLHEQTHSWDAPLLFILVLTILNIGFGWFASRPIMIDGKPA